MPHIETSPVYYIVKVDCNENQLAPLDFFFFFLSKKKKIIRRGKSKDAERNSNRIMPPSNHLVDGPTGHTNKQAHN